MSRGKRSIEAARRRAPASIPAPSGDAEAYEMLLKDAAAMRALGRKARAQRADEEGQLGGALTGADLDLAMWCALRATKKRPAFAGPGRLQITPGQPFALFRDGGVRLYVGEFPDLKVICQLTIDGGSAAFEKGVLLDATVCGDGDGETMIFIAPIRAAAAAFARTKILFPAGRTAPAKLSISAAFTLGVLPGLTYDAVIDMAEDRRTDPSVHGAFDGAVARGANGVKKGGEAA